MNYLLRHIHSIAYALSILIIFQSCLVTSSVEEAVNCENSDIRITTLDGRKYEFNWIEHQGGDIVSIENTEKVYIDKKNVAQIVKYDPDPQFIPLELADTYHGEVSFLFHKKNNKNQSGKYFRLKQCEHVYTACKIIGIDTLTIVIPVDQVAKIKVEDKIATRQLTVGMIAGLAIAGMLNYTFNGNLDLDQNPN